MTVPQRGFPMPLSRDSCWKPDVWTCMCTNCRQQFAEGEHGKICGHCRAGTIVGIASSAYPPPIAIPRPVVGPRPIAALLAKWHGTLTGDIPMAFGSDAFALGLRAALTNASADLAVALKAQATAWENEAAALEAWCREFIPSGEHRQTSGCIDTLRQLAGELRNPL